MVCSYSGGIQQSLRKGEHGFVLTGIASTIPNRNSSIWVNCFTTWLNATSSRRWFASAPFGSIESTLSVAECSFPRASRRRSRLSGAQAIVGDVILKASKPLNERMNSSSPFMTRFVDNCFGRRSAATEVSQNNEKSTASIPGPTFKVKAFNSAGESKLHSAHDGRPKSTNPRRSRDVSLNGTWSHQVLETSLKHSMQSPSAHMVSSLRRVAVRRTDPIDRRTDSSSIWMRTKALTLIGGQNSSGGWK